jgi:hypothetical protein
LINHLTVFFKPHFPGKVFSRLGVELSGRELAQHTWGPGFHPQLYGAGEEEEKSFFPPCVRRKK